MEETTFDGPEMMRRSGEVVKFRAQRQTGYAEAVRELAAFKFGLYRTVVADPLLRGAPCVSLIVVYADFVSIDRRTLKHTEAYASNATVNARAGLKCHKTAGRARRLLEKHGYLVSVGMTNGITVYRLENPHQERVAMHVKEVEEYNREVSADRKRNWNATKTRVGKIPTLDNQRVGEMPIPETDKDGDYTHPRVGEMPIQGRELCPSSKLDKSLQGVNYNSAHEGSEVHPVTTTIKEAEEAAIKSQATDATDFKSQEKKNSYAAMKDGDDFDCIPAPSSDQEAEAILQSLFGVIWGQLHPNIKSFAKVRLMSGNLKSEWVHERLNKHANQPS